MQNIISIEQLQQLKHGAAVLILFGGPHCGVCKSLYPKISLSIAQAMPDMLCVYVDCEKYPEIAAAYGVFSLPVVKTYIDGMLLNEESGAFSVIRLIQSIERPYKIWQESLHSDPQ